MVLRAAFSTKNSSSSFCFCDIGHVSVGLHRSVKKISSSEQGYQNGRPTVKFTVRTSARIRVYPADAADGFYRPRW
jgi:hypothetical protein